MAPGVTINLSEGLKSDSKARAVRRLSSKGRYYLVRASQWQGSLPSAEFIGDEQAAQWLALNDCEVPVALEAIASE